MKLSEAGLGTMRVNKLDEMYPAQDILIQTNQVRQYGSGVYAYDNIPLRVQDNIEKIIKKHCDKIDCIEVQMPVLQQEEIWRRSGRYEGYVENGVMMTSNTDKGNYCLAPTAEEAITIFIELLNNYFSYQYEYDFPPKAEFPSTFGVPNWLFICSIVVFLVIVYLLNFIKYALLLFL